MNKMLNRYPGLFIISLMVVSKLVYGQTIFRSPMTNFNTLDPSVKDQMLSLVEESLRASVLKLNADLKERLDDLRIDMRHRDAELYVEIYNIKETLKQQGFTIENQPADGSEVGQESRELSLKLASLEKGIKETTKESETKIKILKKNIDVMESENRMMSSKLDALQMTFMSMASQSSLRKNISDGVISVDFVHKLKLMDDRLNDFNETIHYNYDTTQGMMRLVGTLNSDIMALNSSIYALNGSMAALNSSMDALNGSMAALNSSMDALNGSMGAVNVSVNSNSHRITNQENALKIETNKLFQSTQICSAGLTALRGNYNLTMSDIGNMKSTQKEISEDLKDHMVMIYSLAGSLNSTRDGLGSLKNKLNLNLTNFQMETQSLWTKALDDLHSNISDITNISNGLRTSIQKLSSRDTDHRLSMMTLTQNVSMLQSDIEQLRYGQNETNAKIIEIRIQHTSAETNISRLLSISSSLRKSAEECEKNISDVQSSYVEKSIEINHLQNHYRNVESNISNFHSLIRQNSIEIENLAFFINMTQQDNAELKTLVTGLDSDLYLLQQNVGKNGVKMKNFESEWSSFQSQYRMEMNSIADSVNSTGEDYKNLTALTDAISASCGSNVMAINISLNQFTEQFSSINASITNLKEDLTTSKVLLESSNFKIHNITTIVQDLQTRMNTSGASNSQLLSLVQSVRNHDIRITNISSIVTSHTASISSLQSNLNVAVAVNNDQNVSISRIDGILITLVPVRLVGGTTSREGRVEIFNSGAWGTVCDDSWDSADARVVCRMLGYTGSYTAYGSARYGPGTGQIWLDDVACSGSESSIFLCTSSGLGTHNCGHGEDASVKCT